MDGTKHNEVLVKNQSERWRDRQKKNSKQQLEAEESVRESEKQHRLFSALNEGACLHEIVYDESGNALDYVITDVNPSFESISGIKREDAIGRKASELYGTGEAPYLEIYTKVAARARASGEPTSFKTYFPLLKKLFSISVFSPDKGKFVTVFVDTTKRTKTEEAISDALEYAESIVDTVREPLVVLDQNLRVISSNRSFYETFKVRPEETEGHIIYDVGNGQWNSPTLRLLLEDVLLKNDSFENFEVDHDFPIIGKRIMILNARRLNRKTDNTEMILLAIEDITERKTLRERMAAAENLAVIGQLASFVGHEIRNPLGVIKNSAYFLKMRLKDVADETVVEHLQILEKKVASANLIISDLLDFARKKLPVLEQADLNETVKNSLSCQTIPEDIKVEKSLGEIPKMLLDKEQVERIWQNLILNAIQAMPEGGKLTIQTTKQDDSAKVIIRDTGVGIPKERMPSLFTPLSSTKAKGVGLGLVICKQIVEGHDGNITVESAVGEGTTFTVKLPIRTEKKISEQSGFNVSMQIEERVKIEK